MLRMTSIALANKGASSRHSGNRDCTRNTHTRPPHAEHAYPPAARGTRIPARRTGLGLAWQRPAETAETAGTAETAEAEAAEASEAPEAAVAAETAEAAEAAEAEAAEAAETAEATEAAEAAKTAEAAEKTTAKEGIQRACCG